MPDLSFGPFLIDIREGVLRRDGSAVPLTPKAFDLLAFMVEQPGRLLSKDELLERVWPGACVEESNIAYNVFALRKALGDTAENAHYIETVPKRGYRFIATVTAVERHGARPADSTAGAVPGSEGVPSRLLPFARLASEPSTATSGAHALRSAEPDASQRHSTPDAMREVSIPTGLRPGAGRPADPRSWSWPHIGGALALVSLIVLAAYSVAPSWRSRSQDETPRALPLTSVAGVVRAPSLSPDANYVVFTWDGVNHDNLDLYVQQVGAGDPLRLTTDPASDGSASWSPDGRTIAFLRRRPGAPDIGVWVVAPLGGSERKIADILPGLPAYRAQSLSWCPDSQCVLVTDAADDKSADAVIVIALNGGEKRQLTFPEGQAADADPVMSPDGRWLVFRRDTAPFSGVYYRVSMNGRMAADGEPVRLTATSSAGKVTWMPDSRSVLFAARGWLWKLDAVRGGAASRLPYVGQDATAPVVASTVGGRLRLVYVRSFADTNVWRIDTPGPGAAALSPPMLAVASTRSDHMADLSPDEQRLVLSSDRSGETEFWVSGLDGTKALQLTEMAILPGFPRWAPNGERVVFHGDPDGRPDVLVVPSTGGTPKILTAKMPNGGFPSFSRDGQWIYFTVVQARQSRIWRMPVDGGLARQVTPNSGALAIESLDGKDLYYLEAPERPSALWRLPLGGGAPIKVLDGVVAGNFDLVEHGIYYIDRPSAAAGSGGSARLCFLDFTSGRSTTVAQNLGRVGFGLSASRDGRRIFYSRVDASVDELMRVDNIR